ncbi:MAG: CaiB/BaiF CoA-transferase family protein [Proteobacteria bacterium]|nr:CaiB/BaiF CoA-transferase family protein [Pseudomonadota bacterium]
MTSPTMSAGPLTGVKVLDLTTIYSGPICTSILGDQGADVIKVESHDGDLMRRGLVARNGVNASFAMMNRNKRSLVLDMKTKDGLAVLHDMIRKADILVENFRPGVMKRLGIDFEQANKINPRLIFVSINGVGESGPYANRRVYDAVIQGISGLASLHVDSSTGSPQMINTLICDKITSVTAAQNIVAALYAREKTGVGQRVEVSMLDASLFFLWPDGMINYSFVGDDVDPAPLLKYSTFVRTTEDGYVAVMPVKAVEIEGVFKALDLHAMWGDERFSTPALRMQNREELDTILNNGYAKFTTEEVCRRLEENDVPYALINQRHEVIDDPQVRAMGALVEFEHAQAGPMRQPRPPGQFHSTPSGLHRSSPGLGEHSEEILREMGRDDAEIARLRKAGVIN